MKIRFQDRATQADFNDLERLRRRFGPDVAVKIATRMAVLGAAKYLAEVPRQPPIRLRTFDTPTGQFTVDLTYVKRLRFAALQDYAQKNGEVVRETVVEIEVLGVD